MWWLRMGWMVNEEVKSEPNLLKNRFSGPVLDFNTETLLKSMQIRRKD